jgi:outer membrane receptor protein involved in Fe transport
VLDASAGWRLPGKLEVRAHLENLADRTYPSSPDEGAAPAAGRSLAVVLAGEL